MLNTFAYTGSLGVAARSAGAKVLNTDLSQRSLALAKESYTLNGWPVDSRDFRQGDFFEVVGQLKRSGQLFDCVFVDPPFFSVTAKGKVDLQTQSRALLNRVRPLIADSGALAFVNNAAFLPGAALLAVLESLCADGYLSLEHVIAVPEDTAGYPLTRVGTPPIDPAPFNHSTKIVILRVKRKDGFGRGQLPTLTERLRDAGFTMDTNDEGNTTRQRWKITNSGFRYRPSSRNGEEERRAKGAWGAGGVWDSEQ